MHNPLTSHVQASTLENMHLINGWSAQSAMNLLILKPQGLVVACDAIFAWQTRDGVPESWSRSATRIGAGSVNCTIAMGRIRSYLYGPGCFGC